MKRSFVFCETITQFNYGRVTCLIRADSVGRLSVLSVDATCQKIGWGGGEGRWREATPHVRLRENLLIVFSRVTNGS